MAEIQISLEAARVNAGLKQSEVAETMGVDRSTVRRWEKGDKVPSYTQCERLSQIYNMPLDYIFFGKKSR